MIDVSSSPNPVDLTAAIVASYVSNNTVATHALPDLIRGVHRALVALTSTQPEAVAVAAAPSPAVSIKRSVTPDFLICLESGKPFKSLKRHLSSQYGMTPADYRAKWGLPPDYPMVAPNYAAARSQVARDTGLGSRTKRGAQKPKAA